MKKYQLTVADYTEPLKGQVEVIIGTTNDPMEGRGMDNLELEEGDELIPRRLNRSDSVSSRLSDSSIMTTMSLPPAYSQLPSRAMSMISLETCKFSKLFHYLTKLCASFIIRMLCKMYAFVILVPPHYDDLEVT